MGHSVSSSAQRTPEKSFRTDSQPVHTGSRPLRINAKAPFLEVMNEVRTELGLSVEAMAINADCPVSAMSDALAGKDGRNFAGHWLIAQGDEFVMRFNKHMEKRLGLSQASIDDEDASRIGELVRLVVGRVLKARREGAA